MKRRKKIFTENIFLNHWSNNKFCNKNLYSIIYYLKQIYLNEKIFMEFHYSRVHLKKVFFFNRTIITRNNIYGEVFFLLFGFGHIYY